VFLAGRQTIDTGRPNGAQPKVAAWTSHEQRLTGIIDLSSMIQEIARIIIKRSMTVIQSAHSKK
jgi:hypothetical protein